MQTHAHTKEDNERGLVRSRQHNKSEDIGGDRERNRRERQQRGLRVSALALGHSNAHTYVRTRKQRHPSKHTDTHKAWLKGIGKLLNEEYHSWSQQQQQQQQQQQHHHQQQQQ